MLPQPDVQAAFVDTDPRRTASSLHDGCVVLARQVDGLEKPPIMQVGCQTPKSGRTIRTNDFGQLGFEPADGFEFQMGKPWTPGTIELRGDVGHHGSIALQQQREQPGHRGKERLEGENLVEASGEVFLLGSPRSLENLDQFRMVERVGKAEASVGVDLVDVAPESLLPAVGRTLRRAGTEDQSLPVELALFAG